MNDNIISDKEQQLVFVQEALVLDGFEKMSVSSSGNAYYKEVRDNVAIVVNLDNGKHDISFLAFGKRVDDDKDGMLEAVKTLIVNAMDGQMPTSKEPDEVISSIKSPAESDGDKEIPVETLTSEVPKPTESVVSNMPVVHEPVQALTVTGVVRPAVSATEALAVWNEFQELQKAILQPSDFQIIKGKEYKVKSAWRKFAAFFNLNDKIVEEIQTPHADGQGWTWKIKVICTAPNGRFTEGVGMCSTSERNFTHVEHDTYATAHTRSKNRAISDMIAAGEVSAEEVGV